jgi:hypothetical protein
MQDASNLSTGAKGGLDLSAQTNKGPLHDQIEGKAGEPTTMILDKTPPVEPMSAHV